MSIKEYLHQYNISYQEVISKYKDDFDTKYNSELEKNWIVPVENKINRLGFEDRTQIEKVINKLKYSEAFEQDDISILSTFISKINSIVNIGNRLNNFKQGTSLEHGGNLNLVELFNEIASANNLRNFRVELNANLKAFLPHLFSVIKHCQDYSNYPIYYKFWKQISKEVLMLNDDYDTLCSFYRTFPIENRTTSFGAYFGLLAHKLIENLKSVNSANQEKYVKYLKDRVINLEEYSVLMDNLPDKDTSKSYWLYQPGEDARFWNSFQEESIIGLGWNNLGDLSSYKSKEAIADKLRELHDTSSSKKNDATANWDFVQSMKVGDIVIVKKGRRKLLGYGEVVSDYYFDEAREEYKSVRKINWLNIGEWDLSFDLVLKTLTDITIYDSEIVKDQKYYDYLLSIMDYKKQLVENQIIDLLRYKNQILHGPPGTGKTFKLKNDYFKHFIVKETAQTREQFLNDFVSDLTWWQIITVVLLDLQQAKVLDIHKHELIRVKEGLSASMTVRPTIWGQLQSHTVLNCDNVNVTGRSEPLYFHKDSKSNWSIVEDALKEKFPEAYDLLSKYKNHVASPDVEIHNYDFVTFHQSFAYEDFIEGIKPNLDEATDGDIKFKIEDGVFKRISEKARRDPQNNYALFIDEINRGNVSAIFGELITLIEDSKRAGMPEQLEVTLPYSKEKFSVPSNLYIIGTMNTADRSVEALDSALRRRFVFEEMLPDSSVLTEQLYGYKASNILETINQRLELLIDRDHCIGHAYFLGKDEETIIDSFYKNIIPLLQEYFFGDYGKIGLVLGEGFVEISKNENVVFADFTYDYKEDLASKPIYRIRDYQNDDNRRDKFGEAIALLMGHG